MRALVTGAGGCIGRAVCAALLKSGVAVRAVDRVEPPGDWGAEWITADLERAPLEPIVAGCDAVIHLAALVHRPEITDPDSYQRANVAVTQRLLHAHGDGPSLLLASTVAVHGEGAMRQGTEDSPCRPTTAYGLSKLRAERIVLDAGGGVLRFPVVYGPGDKGNVGRLISSIARSRFVLPGGSEEPRSMLAAANAASGVEAWLRRPSHGVFLITDDDDASLLRLVRSVERALGKRQPVPVIPRGVLLPAAAAGSALGRLGLNAPLTLERLRKLTCPSTFSCRKARQELSYEPVVTLEQGIAEAVRWMQATSR